jgi:hypothetical protein
MYLDVDLNLVELDLDPVDVDYFILRDIFEYFTRAVIADFD